MITYERWRSKFIFAYPVNLQGIWVKFKVTRAKKLKKCLFPQHKTAFDDNSASPQCENSITSTSDYITHRVVKFTCSIGTFANADQIASLPY